MADYLLKVDNVSKFYSRGGRERQSLGKYLSSMFSSEQPREDEAIWALQNISFEIQRGETLGIIGSNGSGKSTLLSILGGITKPSHGEVRIRGKVASILEVGTGFHPDLTGRDNVYLNGRMMGLSEAEIDKQFEEIVSFSGIRKFIDTAVKYYSSGMYLRLAFSTLVHFKADLLLFDEVLSVGDAEFKKRCYDKISHIKQGAEAMILVSHQLNELQQFCDRVIYLENGAIRKDGKTMEVINQYFKEVYDRELEGSEEDDEQEDDQADDQVVAQKARDKNYKIWNKQSAPGTGEAKLDKLHVYSGDDPTCVAFQQSQPISIQIEYSVLVSQTSIHPGIKFFDQYMNVIIVNAPFWHKQITNADQQGKYRAFCTVPGYLLNKGIYFLEIQFFRNKEELLCEIEDLFRIDIEWGEYTTGTVLDNAPSPVLPKLDWQVEPITS